MKHIATKRCAIFCALFLTALTISAVPVTFQVNMGVQTNLGTFNPESHTVEVRGPNNEWGTGTTLSPDPANANIYRGTVEVTGAQGSEVQYKFVINQAGTPVWENNVGPGAAQNRAFSLPQDALTLPVVYFNNQAAPPGTVMVTFQVNMGVQTAIGNFDPAAHTAEVRGSFDNWGAGLMLAPSATDTNIYQGTATINGSAGAPYEYKFVINQAGTLVYEGNVGSGGPFGNRTFTLASGSEQTLLVVYFNNLTNNPGAGISVTFQANMARAIALGLFDPATGVIDVRGPFNNWGTPSGFVLTNSPSNPSIFMGTLSVSNAAPGSPVPHKFNMNGTWETGNDRTFTLASSAQVLPPRFFDDLADLGRLSVSATVVFDAVELTVSWTGGPMVRLQTKSSLTPGNWQDVPDTIGVGSKTFNFGAADPNARQMFFRLAGP
jgi:hypothetical protein